MGDKNISVHSRFVMQNGLDPDQHRIPYRGWAIPQRGHRRKTGVSSDRAPPFSETTGEGAKW